MTAAVVSGTDGGERGGDDENVYEGRQLSRTGSETDKKSTTRAMKVLHEAEQQVAVPQVTSVGKPSAKEREPIGKSPLAHRTPKRGSRQILEPIGGRQPVSPIERAGLSVYTYNANTSSLELQGASRDAEGAIGVETVRGFSESQPSVMYGTLSS